MGPNPFTLGVCELSRILRGKYDLVGDSIAKWVSAWAVGSELLGS